MTDHPTEKNTKAQILDAYEALLKERNTLEKQMQRSQSDAKPRPTEDPTSLSPRTSAPVTPQPQAAESIGKTLLTLDQLQAGFGTAISELSEQLTAKAVQLQQRQGAIALEAEQLQTHHDLESVEAETLETLLQTYQENATTFATELSQRRTTLEQTYQEASLAWEKEQDTHRRFVQDRNETYQTTTQREEQAYLYTRDLQREGDQKDYDLAQRQRNQELETAKHNQERDWVEREQAIAQQEQQFAALKAQVEAFAKNKAQAIQKAKESATAEAQYQAKVTADLQAKEREGQQRVYELQIQSLEQTIQNQESHLQALTRQLDAARKQVQDLAVKAIEGTSNIQSYEAFKEIALEQAKKQTKGQI